MAWRLSVPSTRTSSRHSPPGTRSGGARGGGIGYARSRPSSRTPCTMSPICKQCGSCSRARSAGSTAYARRTRLRGTRSGAGASRSTHRRAGRPCSTPRTSTCRRPYTPRRPRAHRCSGSPTGRTTTTTAGTSCGTSRCSRFLRSSSPTRKRPGRSWSSGRTACRRLATTPRCRATAERSSHGRAALGTGRNQRPGKAPRARTSIT